MARAPVRQVSGPSAIQGMATPVSTYVRPAEPGRSNLHDLAEGLAAFDSGLSGFLNKKKSEDDAANKARAEVDFHRNNQVSYGEAVRQGLIPASSSPAYVESYKKAQGNLYGLKLGDKFALDYQTWEGRSSADSEGYAAWLSGWMTENIGDEQDENVLTGLSPHLERISMNGLSTFMTERDERIKSEARSTSSALVTHSLAEAADEGHTTGKVDWDGHWNNILAVRTEAISRGDKALDLDQDIVDMIILDAERRGDMEPLTLLERTMPGQQHPLSYDPNVRKKLTQAQDRIESAQGARATTLAAQQELLEKRQHEENLAIATGMVLKGEEVPDELLVSLERRDGEIRMKLAKQGREVDDWESEEDPDAVLHATSEIYNGKGREFVQKLLEDGVIRKGATYDKLMTTVESVQKARGDGGIYTAHSYSSTVKRITDATGAGDINPFTNEKSLSDEGLEALNAYRRSVLSWEIANPNATALEKEDAAHDIGQKILGRIESASDGSGSFISDADQTLRDQEQAEAQAAATAAAEEVARQAQEIVEPTAEGPSMFQTLWDNLVNNDPWDTDSWGQHEAPAETEASAAPEVPAEVVTEQPTSPAPALETLSESHRGAVESLAAKRGISVEEANQRLYEKMQEVRGEQDTEAPVLVDPTTTQSTSNVSPESRQKLEALFNDPPRLAKLTEGHVPVHSILSLIGHTEGTDREDGYNETLSYGAYTGGDVNLVGMTLDEVDALQSKMLRHKDNKWNSSAAGRYQIVRTTLRKLREELGLKGTELYDEKMQDRLAMHLLEGRGFSKWQKGELSDDKFLDNLAKEWASLPTAKGSGYYKGQRASATPAQVLKALYGGPPGHSSAALKPQSQQPSGNVPKAYANIPDVDGGGNAGQVAKFMEWNSDPVANHEANLQSIKPTLASVVRRAQEIAGVKFVVGSGKRDAALQKKAVEWGWSKTYDSDHLEGGAVDLWPLDGEDAVSFDAASQSEIVKAMKAAAKELGVTLDVGADWKSFKDKPHFALKERPTA